MESKEPIYSLGGRITISQVLPAIVAIYLVGWGLFTGNAFSLLFALLPTFVIVFFWQSRYDLYEETLVVRHVWPRRIVIPIREIESTEVMSLPRWGAVMVVRPMGKRPLILRPQAPDQLHERLSRLLKSAQ